MFFHIFLVSKAFSVAFLGFPDPDLITYKANNSSCGIPHAAKYPKI
jgi:hypothetical protein